MVWRGSALFTRELARSIVERCLERNKVESGWRCAAGPPERSQPPPMVHHVTRPATNRCSKLARFLSLAALDD